MDQDSFFVSYRNLTFWYFSFSAKSPKFRVKEVRGFTNGENLIESIRGSTLKHTVILNNLQKIGLLKICKVQKMIDWTIFSKGHVLTLRFIPAYIKYRPHSEATLWQTFLSIIITKQKFHFIQFHI